MALCTPYNTQSPALCRIFTRFSLVPLIKGFPKANAYIDKEGKAKSQIEVSITDMNILTYPDQEKKVVSDESKKADSHSAKYECDDIPF